VWPPDFNFLPAKNEDLALLLAIDRCTLNVNGQTAEADARIVFRPHRFHSAQIELADFENESFQEQPATLRFYASGLEVDDGVLCLNPSWALGSPYRYRVRQSEPMNLVKSGSVRAIEAIVYNLGRFSLCGGPSNGRERLVLDLPSGWSAEIGPLPKATQTQPVFDLLGSPWRVPTNSLRILRKGDAEESRAAIDQTVFLLRYFLSFAWGRHIGFGLTRYLSDDGELVVAQPGITHLDPMIHPANQQPHWFIPSMTPALADILPGFWRRMTDPEWKDHVDWAIYWWLAANKLGQMSETSILAAQAGLEVLAPAVLTKMAGATQRELDSWRKADTRIRKMLQQLKIPLTIPKGLADVSAFARSGPHRMDGPSALTEVRNALAHPEKQGQTGLAYQVSLLGMRYLELALLALFEYKGSLFDHTVFEGPKLALEPVPWMI
jgi:hypothetical protein